MKFDWHWFSRTTSLLSKFHTSNFLMSGAWNPRLFWHKLRVPYEVFVKIAKLLQDHPIFHNNFNNPQLLILDSASNLFQCYGHYGNAATLQNMAKWADVSVGTVHNCYKQVMIAIHSHHNHFIHFDWLGKKLKHTWHKEHALGRSEDFYLLMEHHSSSFRSQASMMKDFLIGNQTTPSLIR